MPGICAYTRSEEIIARDKALITSTMKYWLYPLSVARAKGVQLWDVARQYQLDKNPDCLRDSFSPSLTQRGNDDY